MFEYAETREIILFNNLYVSLSLSEAAKKSGISESNASKILKSFREKMGDPLFIRSNAHMYPTEKAKTIYPCVQRIVASITEIHNNTNEAFEPENLTRHFRILATDVVSCYLLSVATQIIELQCPNASFEVRPLEEKYLDELASWADLAIFTPNANLPKDFESIKLYDTRDVILLRKIHPLLRKKLPPAQFAKAVSAYRKIDLMFAFRSNHKEFSPYDRYADKGEQSAALSSPYIWSIPMALVRSDYTALLPDFAAKYIVELFPKLTYIPLPHQEKSWTTKLIWHKRVSKDPAITWFRSMLFAGIQKEIEGRGEF